jgi:hypothetical protein
MSPGTIVEIDVPNFILAEFIKELGLWELIRSISFVFSEFITGC